MMANNIALPGDSDAPALAPSTPRREGRALVTSQAPSWRARNFASRTTALGKILRTTAFKLTGTHCARCHRGAP